MKSIIVLLFLLLCGTSFGLETDKAAHFGISAVIQTGCYGLMKKAYKLEKEDLWKARLMCAATTLTIGLTKEVFDAKGGRLDGGDMLANMAGVGTATFFSWAFEF